MLSQFNLPIGPFSFAIKTDNKIVIDNISSLYADYNLHKTIDFVDFPITITTRSLLRRLIKPQVDFFIDEFAPFKPLPKDQSFAMLEWGMNWCIATKAHHFLITHAGAIEKNGKVIVMPAEPGSGKSTLTAAMVNSGWRLFSDELALISIADELVYPITRPINLKNSSIDIIDQFADNAVFSSIANDTHKGTVALLKPPTESVQRMHEAAPLHCVVFPKYVANAQATLTAVDTMDCFQQLIHHSFNYHILGLDGFNLIASLMNKVKCYQFEYSDFEQAKILLNNLVE
ncbi:MAG: HprK-related kinase A [Pseudomonadota bacterium]